MSDNILDSDLDAEDINTEDWQSREQLLANYMAGLGFRPKTPRVPDTLEYFKNFGDPSGKIGRVVAVIKRDDVGLEPKAPEYFTVTVQIHVPAHEESVKSKAPTFCRADLLRILAHFDDVETRREAEVGECALCGVPMAEFLLRDGAKTCMDCAKRKGM